MKLKSIVIYYSETGNTEKLAIVIAKVINCDVKKIEDIKIKELSDYDLIFLGTPVHGSAPAKKVKTFLENFPNMQGKRGAVFCTMHNFGDKRVFRFLKQKFAEKGITFIDGFSCLGQSRLIANFGPRIFNKNRPDGKDLKEAEEFAKRVIEIASN